MVGLLVAVAASLAPGCSSRDIEAEKRLAVGQYFARAASCKSDESPESDLHLAVVSVTNAPNATLVRLVGYARDAEVDFDLPVYRLSAGRWLIGEKGRTYLLDERCREYKLKDRKSDSSRGLKLPLDGRLRLRPGWAFEATLVFNPLPDDTRIGSLVYDGRVLPFTIAIGGSESSVNSPAQ
jgi:hypothetical protein